MGFSPGGGGSGSIGTSTDVAVSSPSNGQVLAWDGGIGKWKNESPSSTGSIISQAEAEAGTAITARAVSAASLKRDVNYWMGQRFVVLEANDPAGTDPGVIYFRKAV